MRNVNVDDGGEGAGPAALCENCGEAAHVYFCPKPPAIPADVWQAMDDDERLEAERRHGSPAERSPA